MVINAIQFFHSSFNCSTYVRDMYGTAHANLINIVTAWNRKGCYHICIRKTPIKNLGFWLIKVITWPGGGVKQFTSLSWISQSTVIGHDTVLKSFYTMVEGTLGREVGGKVGVPVFQMESQWYSKWMWALPLNTLRNLELTPTLSHCIYKWLKILLY